MREDWEEITIGANSKKGLLAKIEDYQSRTSTEERLTWTPISPVETVRIRKKKSYKIKILFLTIFFLILQLGCFFYAEKFLFSMDKDDPTMDYPIFLDVASQSITNELNTILGEAKKIYKTENLLTNQKEMMGQLIFSPDSKYLYFGIFEVKELKLYMEDEYFLESFSLQEADFKKKLVMEEGDLIRSIDGNAYLHNLTNSQYNGIITLLTVPRENSKILFLGFDSSHWAELFAGIKLGTFFIMNDSGAIILHSDKEVTLTGADYSGLKFLDFILKEKPHNLTREIDTQSGKKIKCHVRKIIPVESYIVFLEEVKPDAHKVKKESIFVYIGSSFLFLMYAFFVLRIFKNSRF